jgi:dTDP-4-amino-4,6-dideoxygalactose transaminase
VRLKLNQIGLSHRAVFEGMRAKGIGVNLHYIPVHQQPDYRQFGFRNEDFPEAERYYQEAMSLPIFFDMTDEQQNDVVVALRQLLVRVQS